MDLLRPNPGSAPWSSYRRLLELPPVFSPMDLAAQFGAGKLSTARVLLTRWHRAGLTMPVSPRGGVCLNLVKMRAVASMDGVREGVGSRSVVSDALTEQLRIVVRPARWYSAVHDGGGVLQLEWRRAPMNILTPAWALADAIVFGTGAGMRLSLGADDIDIDEMDEAEREEFFTALGVLAEVGRVRTPWGAGYEAAEHLAMDDDGIAERMQEAMDRITPRTYARRKRLQIG